MVTFIFKNCRNPNTNTIELAESLKRRMADLTVLMEALMMNLIAVNIENVLLIRIRGLIHAPHAAGEMGSCFLPSLYGVENI